jgi:cytochrome b pre-mRNA-processing protein 3
MLNFLGSSGARRKTVTALYDQLVTRSRAPVFYAKLGVPDTIDGRFDMLALHAFLLLERLREVGASEVSQGVMDSLFVGMDEGLRDLGAGDMGMGRKMKSLANAFYGRMKAYGDASGEAALAQAIQRNIYREQAGHEKAAAILATYMLAARMELKGADVAKGNADFGPLPQV